MFNFPKIEKLTRDAAIAHFFLMFGYKVFSLYFPLFLLNKGFSLPQVGYTYLLIYLPIAFLSPVVAFFNHKMNPAVLASLGILGYGFYSLGMIIIDSPSLFYLWQVVLGASAALFTVSSRAILMGSHLENSSRSFAWFYSAPFYADAVAPAVGAFLIWKFNFIGVFIVSMAVHLLNVLFCLSKLTKPAQALPDHGFHWRNLKQNYSASLDNLKQKAVILILLSSFLVLFLGGFYRAFWVLFLKLELGWSQNLILVFGAVFSLIFLPLSLYLVKKIGERRAENIVISGTAYCGIFTILFGLFAPFLNFFSVLAINIGRSAGGLLAGAGRSGAVGSRLKECPEEASAIDSIFAPLGTALGSLVFGLLIVSFGYNLLFVSGGALVLLSSIIAKKVILK